VTGDTVAILTQDTSGPAINPMIKSSTSSRILIIPFFF